VADHQFLFALKSSDQPRFDAMLTALAWCVLEQVGYAVPEIADMLTKLREALEPDETGECSEGDVQFRAEGGQLIIVVSYAGGREWRMTRALPD